MNASQSLAKTGKIRLWEVVLWALLLSLPLVLPTHALLISEIAIIALFAMSLDLILGYNGIVSLGHAAFFGMGAYTAALFAKHLHPDPLSGLLVAVVFSGVLGAVCSLGVLRGTDLTRIMVTLGVALILQELANKLDWLTGGADGLQGVVMGPVLGRFEFDLYGQTAAWYALGVCLTVFVMLRRLVHSPFGFHLQAIRDNRLRAQAIGIPVHARLVAIYTLSAALAGLAGGLQAQTTGFASLDVFGFDRSADVLLMLVIGGTGWLWGGIIGAVVFKILHSVISAWTPQYWTFWLGLFLVLLMLVGRERLLRPWVWGRKS
jgi:branched-chain amino acid transport system permease protein